MYWNLLKELVMGKWPRGRKSQVLLFSIVHYDVGREHNAYRHLSYEIAII